jgi:hypothetical protein
MVKIFPFAALATQATASARSVVIILIMIQKIELFQWQFPVPPKPYQLHPLILPIRHHSFSLIFGARSLPLF